MIQSAAAIFGRNVRCVKPQVQDLPAYIIAHFPWHDAGALYFSFQRIEFGLDEAANGIDDHLLFVVEFEIHQKELLF
jgi:hypothetical protein